MNIVYLEADACLPYVEPILHGVAQVYCGHDNDDHEANAIKTDAKGLIITSKWIIDGPALSRMPRVQVVARPGIGYDNIDTAAATEYGVAVVNTPDGPTQSTAELTVTLMMALARRLPKQEQAARNVRFSWVPELKGMELAGKTLGLLGLGRIGARVAEICAKGLRMRVLAYDPYVSPDRAASVGAVLAPSFHDILPRVDILSLHAPPGPETRKIMDATTLAMLKPGALLINCARGSLIDEAALIQALQEGHLGGAGLDVYDPEPPRPDNPLLAMDNVILTPHVGSFTEDGLKAMGKAAAQGVKDVLEGRRPQNLVNPEVWPSPSRRKG